MWFGSAGGPRGFAVVMGSFPLALGAAPAGDRFHDLYLFSALVLDQVADEDEAVVTAVRTKALQTGMVGVESFAGFAVVVYASGVHWALSLWAGLRGISRQTSRRGRIYV